MSAKIFSLSIFNLPKRIFPKNFWYSYSLSPPRHTLYTDMHLLRLHEFLSSTNGKNIIGYIRCRWHVERLEKCVCTSLCSNPINGHFSIHSEKMSCDDHLFLVNLYVGFAFVLLLVFFYILFAMYWRRFIMRFE